jgi:hypothetical protein
MDGGSIHYNCTRGWRTEHILHSDSRADPAESNCGLGLICFVVVTTDKRVKEVRENENRKMMLCTSVNFTMLLFACLLYGMIDRANATIMSKMMEARIL